MNISQDQLNAVARHVVGNALAFCAGFMVALAIGGSISSAQIDVVLRHLDGMEKYGVVLVWLAGSAMAARGAFKSASPEEQIRKVEQNVPGVVVTPVDAKGAVLIEKATGQSKPIEVPTVVVQQ